MTPDERLERRAKVRATPQAPGKGRGTPVPLDDMLGFLLNQCAAAIRMETAAALEDHGVTPREAGVLVALRDHAPVVQQELAERVRIDRTTMMQVANTLLSAGLVMRQAHPTDGRAWVLSLTPKGERTAIEVGRRIDTVQRAFMAKLPPSEQARLKRTLTTLLTDFHARSTKQA